MKSDDVQSLLLKALTSQDVDARLGWGQHYLGEHVRSLAPANDQPTRDEIMAGYWSLAAQGLAYIDLDHNSQENWSLRLTEAGVAAAGDNDANPDDPAGYLRRLFASAPGISATTRLYIDEAVRSYYNRAYVACTAMLGVAAESAFVDMAESFVTWAPPSASKLRKLLDNPRANYVERFGEFRKKIEELRSRVSPDLRDGLDIHLSAVLDLLRTTRNDAGHPTGRTFGRDDCFSALRVFERLARRMYALKAFFERGTA
ncbi:MAG: hypothetical protein QOI24_2758 [Acidobacteriota bacterium]|jgi:hypothetical protein|nr:hypothetical protein [Acidobacteriota bacterium]